MENKVGLYRMLIDASCAIFQNLSAVSDLMSDSSVKSAKESLREIATESHDAIGDYLVEFFTEK